MFFLFLFVVTKLMCTRIRNTYICIYCPDKQLFQNNDVCILCMFCTYIWFIYIYIINIHRTKLGWLEGQPRPPLLPPHLPLSLPSADSISQLSSSYRFVPRPLSFTMPATPCIIPSYCDSYSYSFSASSCTMYTLWHISGN